MATKVSIVSLGCAKNLVDSEWMLGLLREKGYELTGAENEAEVIIINTCGFITPAKEEAIEAIFDAVRYKKSGRAKAVIVAGCLAQRYGQVLLDEIPEIDGVMGTGFVPFVDEAVKWALKEERFLKVSSPSFSDTLELPRIVTTPFYSAYLKIADGCSNRCAYCAIPGIRGNYHSRPMDNILKEAYQLAESGVKEIILIAQDSTAYGTDFGKPMLSELVKKIAELKIPWIRLMYCYPTEFTNDLIETIATYKNICRYLDIPLQHASPRILKAMNRRGSIEDVEALLENLRQNVPDIALRTTFMVGFPGETEKDFEDLLSFMSKIRFQKAGVFSFSKEEGTLAANMPNQVSEEEKERRYEKAMLHQQQISKSCNENLMGKTLSVLVEENLSENYKGRSEFDSPQIDGSVFFKPKDKIVLPGDIVKVRINGFDEYDLRGEIV